MFRPMKNDPDFAAKMDVYTQWEARTLAKPEYKGTVCVYAKPRVPVTEKVVEVDVYTFPKATSIITITPKPVCVHNQEYPTAPIVYNPDSPVRPTPAPQGVYTWDFGKKAWKGTKKKAHKEAHERRKAPPTSVHTPRYCPPNPESYTVYTQEQVKANRERFFKWLNEYTQEQQKEWHLRGIRCVHKGTGRGGKTPSLVRPPKGGTDARMAEVAHKMPVIGNLEDGVYTIIRSLAWKMAKTMTGRTGRSERIDRQGGVKVDTNLVADCFGELCTLIAEHNANPEDAHKCVNITPGQTVQTKPHKKDEDRTVYTFNGLPKPCYILEDVHKITKVYLRMMARRAYGLVSKLNRNRTDFVRPTPPLFKLVYNNENRLPKLVYMAAEKGEAWERGGTYTNKKGEVIQSEGEKRYRAKAPQCVHITYHNYQGGETETLVKGISVVYTSQDQIESANITPAMRAERHDQNAYTIRRLRKCWPVFTTLEKTAVHKWMTARAKGAHKFNMTQVEHRALKNALDKLKPMFDNE